MPVDWYAESFRLTIMVGPDWTRRPLFAELSGVDPEQFTENAPLQLRQETGLFLAAHLSIIQQPGRIDILLSDLPTQNVRDPTAPNYKKFFWIDRWPDALSRFDRISSKVRNISPIVQRVAYAVALICPTVDASTASRALRDMLPFVQFNPDKDTDIFWNINRPREIEFVGTINRLSKWNVLQSGFITIPSVGGDKPLLVMPSTPTEFALRAEIDINTSPNNTEIDGTAIPKIIELLRSLAAEIAEKGDLP